MPLSGGKNACVSTTPGFALIWRLRCLVIVELKVGKFTYADAGQMHLYLNYARANWMREGENPPVG